MQKRTLISPAGYEPQAVATRTLASQLDPLLEALTARVKDASVAELEWQLRPGVNTPGMLLAHLALAETYWMQMVGRDVESPEEWDRIALEVTGLRMDGDGMPLPPHGRHPATLAGKTAGDYLEMLRRAREATHATLCGWGDHELEQTHTVDGREVSRAWILFHVVEHFAQHLGQIALLASIRRGAGGG
jgi:hypothetical protein